MNTHLLIVCGNATRDAEELTSRKKETEKKFTKFSVAVNEYNPVAKKEDPYFYDILVFGKSAEKALEKVKKGDTILVFGKPDINLYVPKKGDPKASISVIAESWKVLK